MLIAQGGSASKMKSVPIQILGRATLNTLVTNYTKRTNIPCSTISIIDEYRFPISINRNRQRKRVVILITIYFRQKSIIIFLSIVIDDYTFTFTFTFTFGVEVQHYQDVVRTV